MGIKMKLKNLSKGTVPFIEILITSLIILLVISIDRGLRYEHKLKAMEYPMGFTAIGASLNLDEIDSYNPWEIYRKLIGFTDRKGYVITHFIDYYNEMINNSPNDKNLLNDFMNVQMIGTDNRYFDYFKPKLRKGRYFTADENKINVCIIGENLAKHSFGSIEGSIGKTLKFPDIYSDSNSSISVLSSEAASDPDTNPFPETVEMKIIGVLKGSEKLPARTIDFYNHPYKTVNIYTDDLVIFPASTVNNSTADYSSTIWMDRDMNEGKKAAIELFNISPELTLTVNPKLKTFLKSSVSETVILVILNSFVFLVFIVAGIGLMGIQLISVGRRREEIGLRMAFGARKRNIAAMIFTETIKRFLLPTICGILTGLNILPYITDMIGIPVLIDIMTVFLCIAASALFAACIGLYPAVKAASLDPVNAIGRTPGLN